MNRNIVAVPREFLEALAAESPQPQATMREPDRKIPSTGIRFERRLRVADWLRDNGVEFRVKDQIDSLGRTVYLLAACPFNPAHANGEACIMQAADGKLSAKCFHTSCAEKRWADFKKAIGIPQTHHLESSGNGSPCPAAPKTNPTKAGTEPRDHSEIRANRRQLREISEEAIEAIVARNNPPFIFVWSNSLARIQHTTTTGSPIARVLDNDSMRGILARVANWQNARDTKHGPVVEDTSPPMEMVRDVISLSEWPEIPVLEAIVETPVFSKEGVLIVTPGYSADAKIWYQPTADLQLPAHPIQTRAGDIDWAREFILNELLGEFPFVDQSSRAHMLAAMILPFIRQMINGPTPMHVFDAPTEGTGKTMLCEIVGRIGTGQPLQAEPQPADEAEFRKKITTVLLEGSQFIFFDNLSGKLNSGTLASALTSIYWRDRLLCTNRTVSVPNRAVWLASGNNSILSPEMNRRTIRCRLDAKIEDPWKRKGFRIKNLRDWVEKNRSRLVLAILTLCQSWIDAGRPKGNQTLGMFESWASTMGGILDVAGVPGLLENMNRSTSNQSDQSDEWHTLVTIWWQQFNGSIVGANELIDLVIREKLLDEVLGDGGDRSQRTRFGMALNQVVDRVYSGFRIERADNDHQRRKQFRLVQIREPNSNAHETECNS